MQDDDGGGKYDTMGVICSAILTAGLILVILVVFGKGCGL